MTIWLAATEDVLAPGQPLALAPAVRALYVRCGAVRIGSEGPARLVAPDTCRLAVGAATLEGEGEVWGFEVSAGRADGTCPRTVLAVPLARDPTLPFVLRADRIDFEPGGVTPRHGHAGPGIRRLLQGRLFAELGPQRRRIGAGEAWFESGPEAIVGHNLAPATAFVRAMVLDAELLGRPTFRPWTEADATKPRGTRARLFFDELVRLPPAPGGPG